MLASITFAWLLGMFIDRNRGRPRGRFYFVLSVAISLAGLLFFKYTDFFISNFNAVFGTDIGLLKLALPIGISFYTFQILSYTIDVYRGNVGVQRSWVKLAAYVTLFPQLIAGPIVRYADVEHELSHRIHSMEKISEGAFRFVIGLAKRYS